MELLTFNNTHGFKVFFFPGSVRQLGIAKRHLQVAVPQQLLQTLDAHAGIEQLGGKGVPQTVQGVALVRQIGSF
jgi:hypothetical protein